MKRALISVYDKTGVTDLAAVLHAAGVEIVSTGSTAATIAAAGVPVTQVAEVTGFPEILDGRVKTLHPRIHGGILADRRKAEHRATLDEHGITGVDLVVANLYPFSDTVASGAGVEDCIEQIDIGGPAMVRAAAKNHANTAVVVSPADYADVVAVVRSGEGFSDAQRRELAVKAFRHTAEYDVAVASWLGAIDASPTHAARLGRRYLAARRGPALRREPAPAGGAVHQRARRRAWPTPNSCTASRCPTTTSSTATPPTARPGTSSEPAAAIIKHANPCGIAVGADLLSAYRAAFDTDPVSAYRRSRRSQPGGGRRRRSRHGRDLPRGDHRAVVHVRGAGRAAAEEEPAPAASRSRAQAGAEVRFISGGMLMQGADRIDAPGDDPAQWTLAAGEPADETTLRRSRVRLARLPGGQEQRDSAGQGARLRWASAWARSTGWIPPGWRWHAPVRSGRRVRLLPPTPSSRSRTDSKCCWLRASRRWYSPVVLCATRKWSLPPAQPGLRCTSPGCGTSSTDDGAKPVPRVPL
ncbi:MAG: hypothetical protein V9G10_14175 [Candidatus Nanopelagicales bacterium]